MFTREGGSIPVVSTFQEELGLPSVLFGVGLPDENAHAPNEKLDLGNFHDGIIASAILYDEIAERADATQSKDTEEHRRTMTALRMLQLALRACSAVLSCVLVRSPRRARPGRCAGSGSAPAR